jgi:hypothetical protein
LDDKGYQQLRESLEQVPPGDIRDQAFNRIQRLACLSPDKTLASCDAAAKPPLEATAGRKMLEEASVDEKTFGETLAGVLRGLVCSGSDETIHVVRGLSRDAAGKYKARLEEAGAGESGLIDDLLDKNSDCLVAATLTDADRTKLMRIKQRLLQRAGK